MTTATQKPDLQRALEQMDAEIFQKIRDSYFKAIEGLTALEEVLAGQLSEDGPRIPWGCIADEHVLAKRGLVAIRESSLGKFV